MGGGRPYWRRTPLRSPATVPPHSGCNEGPWLLSLHVPVRECLAYPPAVPQSLSQEKAFVDFPSHHLPSIFSRPAPIPIPIPNDQAGSPVLDSTFFADAAREASFLQPSLRH